MPWLYQPPPPSGTPSSQPTLPVSFFPLLQPCPRSRLGSLLSFLCSDTFSCPLWAFKVKSKGLGPGPCAYTLLVLDNHEASRWAGLGWARLLFSPATYGALDFLLTHTLLPLPHKYPPGVLTDMETLWVLQMIPLELCTKVASVDIFL